MLLLSTQTAAFAIPILHHLSSDPYGIYAIVVTPTRELAFQIKEQFKAFGAPISLRVSVLVGGMSKVQQAMELQKFPHIVVATPGRLVDHLTGPTPPRLHALRFLVLDEADRLLEPGAFNDDMRVVLQLVPRPPQVLLFSATTSPEMETTHGLQLRDPYRWSAPHGVTTVAKLREEYVFVPAQVKMAYLAYAVRTQGPLAVLGKDGSDAGEDATGSARESVFDRAAAIVFVSTCYGAQLLNEVMLEMQVPSVCLHSVMSQGRRLAALAKFKSGQVSGVRGCHWMPLAGLTHPCRPRRFFSSLPTWPRADWTFPACGSSSTTIFHGCQRTMCIGWGEPQGATPLHELPTPTPTPTPPPPRCKPYSCVISLSEPAAVAAPCRW